MLNYSQFIKNAMLTEQTESLSVREAETQSLDKENSLRPTHAGDPRFAALSAINHQLHLN